MVSTDKQIIRQCILRFCLLSLLLFGFTGTINASNLLKITDAADSHSLTPFFSLLEDPTNKLTINDVKQSRYSKQFRKNENGNLSLGFSSSTYWLRFKVINTSTNRSWLIQHNYPSTHTMDVYEEANNYRAQTSGSVLPLSARDNPLKDILFTSILPRNTKQFIYIKIKTRANISLDISLLTEQAYIKKSSQISLILGVFYGALIIIGIYNLCFFISLREISYLYLSIFMLFCGLSFSLYDGYLQLTLSATQLLASPFLIAMFIAISAMTLILHCKAFLILNKKLNYINKFHNLLLASWLVIATLSPFSNLEYIHKVIVVLAMFTGIYLFVMSILGWRENKPAARYAAIGWVVFCITVLLYSLGRLQFISESFVIEYMLRAAITFLVLLLSVAFLIRINKLRVFNEKSRDILIYSEMQRNLALEASNLGIWRWQLASDAIYWSNRTCEIFGIKEHETPKNFKEYASYIHPDDLDKLEKTVEKAIENQTSYSIQHRIIKPDGSEAWVQGYGKIEFNDENKLIGTIGTIQDISDLKQVETEKQQTQRLYEDIFSSATEGFVIRDLTGITIEANSAMYNMYGYSKEEYLKLNLRQLAPKGFEEDIVKREQIISNSKTYFTEAKRIRKDGSIFDVEIHASLISYQGEPHVFSIVHDITERKKTENVIKNIAEGVSTATGEEFFKQLVLQIAKLFHAQYVFISLLNDDNTKDLNTYVLCIGGEIADNITYEHKNTPCGAILNDKTCAYPTNVQSLFPLDKLLVDMNADSYVGTPLFNTNGKPIGVIVIIDTKPMENIEYTKEIMQIFAARTAAELERAKALNELQTYQEGLELKVQHRTKELEAVNLELESFSYSVSHDLRSPLRAIDGFSKALIDEYGDKFDADGHDLLSRVRKNTVRMGKLIDGLLNLSRLGRAKLNIESLKLGKIADEIMANFRENEPDRQVEFKNSVNDTVTGDADQLRIVIDNLLGNAWKYSSKKEITKIEFGRKRIKGKTTYYITDNGAGFDMQYADKLFGAFQRLHGREYEGSGIGLATVQRIIHRHHGSIWADAEIGKGATFFFTLGNTHEPSINTKNN